MDWLTFSAPQAGDSKPTIAHSDATTIAFLRSLVTPGGTDRLIGKRNYRNRAINVQARNMLNSVYPVVTFTPHDLKYYLP